MTDTPRLPIPIHGKRHQLGDDHHEASPELVGEATRLLHQVQLMASTADVPVLSLTRTTAKGETVKAQVNGPLAFTTIRGVPKAKPKEPAPQPEELPDYPQRLVWMPEGLVITPRTPSVPHGYGMPPTPDGKGTPGGLLQQVVINRYKNNQYPDALYEQVVREKGGEPNENTVVVCSPFFFMDWELTSEDYGIGVTYGKLGKEPEFYPQFKSRWVPNYREPDGGRWFCHRPMHHLKETAFDRAVRDETNRYREEVGQPPLNPPLRGTTYELTAAITYQMKYSKMLTHDWDGYREGYYKLFDRVSSRSGLPFIRIGENLALAPGKPNTKDFGIRVSTNWRNSPPHYANMILSWQGDDNTPLYPTLESHALGDTRITQTITPPSETPEELVAAGTGAAQVFWGRLDWLRVGWGKSTPGRPEARVITGMYGETLSDMHIQIYTVGGTYMGISPLAHCFSFGGRTIPVFGSAESSVNHSVRVVGAKAVYSGDTVVSFRVVLIQVTGGVDGTAQYKGDANLLVYEGDAEDFAGTKRIIASMALSRTHAHAITRPVWSDSGNRMCFGYLEVHRCQEYDGRFGAKYDEVMEYANRFVGQQIQFFEVEGSSMSPVGSPHTLPYLVDGEDNPGGIENLTRECSGSIPYFPVYVDESLDFVYLTVNSRVERKFLYSFNINPIEKSHVHETTKQVRGWLEFPNGASFEFQRIDGYMKHHTGGLYHNSLGDEYSIFDSPPVTGFVCHLYPFDPAHPERMSYIRYDLPETHDADTGVVATLYLEGEAVRTADKALERMVPSPGEKPQFVDVGGVRRRTTAWTLYQPDYYNLAGTMGLGSTKCTRGVHPFEPIFSEIFTASSSMRASAVMPTIDAFRGEPWPSGKQILSYGYPITYLSPAAAQHCVFALPGENTAVFVAPTHAPGMFNVGAWAVDNYHPMFVEFAASALVDSIGGVFRAEFEEPYGEGMILRTPPMDYVNVGPIIITHKSSSKFLSNGGRLGGNYVVTDYSFMPNTETVDDEYPFPKCGYGFIKRMDGSPAIYSVKGIDSRDSEFYSIQYGNERIVAGKVTNTLGHKPLWEGGDQYFYKSTLDLKAITGFDNLLNNILPIGVI